MLVKFEFQRELVSLRVSWLSVGTQLERFEPFDTQSQIRVILLILDSRFEPVIGSGFFSGPKVFFSGPAHFEGKSDPGMYEGSALELTPGPRLLLGELGLGLGCAVVLSEKRPQENFQKSDLVKCSF
jgi:hypothetical protein